MTAHDRRECFGYIRPVRSATLLPTVETLQEARIETLGSEAAAVAPLPEGGDGGLFCCGITTESAIVGGSHDGEGVYFLLDLVSLARFFGGSYDSPEIKRVAKVIEILEVSSNNTLFHIDLPRPNCGIALPGNPVQTGLVTNSIE